MLGARRMNGRKQQTTEESETVQTAKVRQPRLRVAPERRDEGNKAAKTPHHYPQRCPFEPGRHERGTQRGKETPRVRERVVGGEHS